MKTQPITELNKEALKDIGSYIENSNWKEEPVIKKITFNNFSDLNCNISAILQAIEMIGFNGTEIDLSVCASLACIARKLLPNNEMEFLDNLLVKENHTADKFINITHL